MTHNFSRKVSAFLLVALLFVANICIVLAHIYTGFFGIVTLLIVLVFPGFLIIKKTNLEYWPKLCISIALSISILLIDGLFLNTVLPILGDKEPLKLLPIGASLDLLILGLICKAFLSHYTISIKSIKASDALVYIGGIVMILLSMAGAIRVNNNGSPIVSIIVIFIVALLSLAIILKQKLLSSHIPFILFSTSLSLLLLWSFRSYYLSGSDIGLEHYVFTLTMKSNRWSPSAYNNPYNACLSITILPTMLARLSNITGTYIFKFWDQLIFAFTTPIIYMYFKKLLNPVKAFLAALFFCTQSVFILWLPMITRQEIALLFFAAIMLIQFGDLNLSDRTKKLLTYSFALSLIACHYSTAYITAIVLIVGMIVKRSITTKRWPELPKKNFLSPIFLMAFVLVTFFWQAQITSTSSNFTSVLKDTYLSLSDSNGDSAKNGSANKVFSLNPFEGSTPESIVQKYTSQQSQSTSTDSYSSSNNYEKSESPIESYTIPVKSNILYRLIQIMDALDSIILRLSLLVGLIWLCLNVRKKHYLDLFSYCVGFVVLLLFLAVFPFISTAFNIERLYQNSLVLLALPIIAGIFYMSERINKLSRYSNCSAYILIIIFFFYGTGVMSQLAGGQPSAILNNKGYYYDQNYTTKQEVVAIEWLRNNAKNGTEVYADKASERVLASYGGFTNINRNLLPDDIIKKSYVYLGRSNIVNDEMFEELDSNNIVLSTPKQFLSNDKNEIYSTNQSEIYY